MSSLGVLSLEGTVQHALVLDRDGHGDAQLPVPFHGALDGLISVGVSGPAATSHLQQPQTRHATPDIPGRGFTSCLRSYPVGDVPVQHQTGPLCCFIGTVQQQTKPPIDYLTPAGGNQG